MNSILYSKSAVCVQGDQCYHQSFIHNEQYLLLLKWLVGHFAWLQKDSSVHKIF